MANPRLFKKPKNPQHAEIRRFRKDPCFTDKLKDLELRKKEQFPWVVLMPDSVDPARFHAYRREYVCIDDDPYSFRQPKQRLMDVQRIIDIQPDGSIKIKVKTSEESTVEIKRREIKEEVSNPEVELVEFPRPRQPKEAKKFDEVKEVKELKAPFELKEVKEQELRVVEEKLSNYVFSKEAVDLQRKLTAPPKTPFRNCLVVGPVQIDRDGNTTPMTRPELARRSRM